MPCWDQVREQDYPDGLTLCLDGNRTILLTLQHSLDSVGCLSIRVILRLGYYISFKVTLGSLIRFCRELEPVGTTSFILKGQIFLVVLLSETVLGAQHSHLRTM